MGEGFGAIGIDCKGRGYVRCATDWKGRCDRQGLKRISFFIFRHLFLEVRCGFPCATAGGRGGGGLWFFSARAAT